MAVGTWEGIEKQTLASSASSVTFSSIPNTFTDLILISDYSLTANGSPIVRLNGDTGSNYSRMYIGGNGGAQTAHYYSTTSIEIGFFGSGNRLLSVMQFGDYAATDKHKPVLDRINNMTGFPVTNLLASRWASTSAITSITYTAGSNFATGSVFTLIGIRG